MYLQNCCRQNYVSSEGLINREKLQLHNENCIVMISIVIYICFWSLVRTCWWRWVALLKAPSSVIVITYILYVHVYKVMVHVSVFNSTFYNNSVILWLSVLLSEETGVPRENHRTAASHWQTLSHNVVSVTCSRSLVVYRYSGFHHQ
jgi:hypothetical protein